MLFLCFILMTIGIFLICAFSLLFLLLDIFLLLLILALSLNVLYIFLDLKSVECISNSFLLICVSFFSFFINLFKELFELLLNSFFLFNKLVTSIIFLKLFLESLLFFFFYPIITINIIYTIINFEIIYI